MAINLRVKAVSNLVFNFFVIRTFGLKITSLNLPVHMHPHIDTLKHNHITPGTENKKVLLVRKTQNI